jgi:hypothetical protein
MRRDVLNRRIVVSIARSSEELGKERVMFRNDEREPPCERRLEPASGRSSGAL